MHLFEVIFCHFPSNVLVCQAGQVREWAENASGGRLLQLRIIAGLLSSSTAEESEALLMAQASELHEPFLAGQVLREV